MPLHLVVVTPEGPLVDAQVESVVCPGAEGEFGVLPLHEPILAPLGAGEVSYRGADGVTHRISVQAGFAEVTQERVTLLATGAQRAS